ncbi:DNA polymerase subunit delta-2 [Dissostichus eleginoides]|uniref:DNA polymerase subunit delta-2 n=1 Tax=Dissostichus eleginoides TaxID=100907 RepID=A0AAD9BZD2_DISEL|nr:DNA polymerase subunit delta-2 [Dissostichus eleginoides]
MPDLHHSDLLGRNQLLYKNSQWPTMSFHVPMLIKGLRKQEPSLTAKRLPLTSDLLSLCIRSLGSGYLSPMVELTRECMFLLAFFGFLRCSEFASTSSAYNPHHHLSLSNILRRTKTDQLGISFPIYIFRLNSYLIPYEPLTKYLSASHSFHIGAASTAARLGIFDQTIQVLGHWLSQANHAYICNNLNDLRHAHAQLSSI